MWRKFFLFVVGVLALARTAAVPPAFMYGIDDKNQIIEYDPIGKTHRNVQSTNLTKIQGSNAFAFDTGKNQMYWLYQGDSLNGAGLYAWNQITGIYSRIADQSASWGTGAKFPANAVFYTDSSTGKSYYVWITESGSNINFLPLNYGPSGDPIGVGTRIQRTITGTDFSVGKMNFGDIAIIPSTRQLYGATSGGIFFKIDLSTALVQDRVPYTQIKTGNPSLQIAFDCQYSILYGQEYKGTDLNTNNWHTINIANGALTSISNYSTEGADISARDLGGSSCTESPLTGR
jgi:hypothetical protein